MRSGELERLAAAVERMAGIVTPPGGMGSLERAARRRAREVGLGNDVSAYVRRLLAGQLPGEWPRLLSVVTVNESSCFRGRAQLEAFERVVLPELVAARRDVRRVRLWSAGCARGEEPATLAVILAERLGLSGWDWRIHATDIDREALAAAARWRFPPRALREVPPEVLRRHFRREGNLFRLDPRLAGRIELGELNLVAEPFAPPERDLDAIFLRNVLIYFRPESQRRVVARLARCLAPHGRLVLGPAEVLWHRCDDLEVEDVGNAFFYRKRRRAAAGPARPARPVQRPRPRQGPPPSPAPPATVTPPRSRLEEAVAALERGDLGAAREALEAAGPVGLEPDLHVLRGLLAEAEGDPEEAVAAYRAALYLDPGLVPVRLLLGEVLLALGRAGRARVELLRVLEDAPRGRELEWGRRLAMPTAREAAARARRLLGPGGQSGSSRRPPSTTST